MVFSQYNVKIILSVLLKEGLSRVKTTLFDSRIKNTLTVRHHKYIKILECHRMACLMNRSKR